MISWLITALKMPQDALVLSTLGLLPNGFDLIDFYTELYSEQIAGYYDDEIGEMFVVQGEGFGGSENVDLCA